jgi:hypothetical protein
MTTLLTVIPGLQDFLKASASLYSSAASNQDGMADGNTSAISPIPPVGDPEAAVGAAVAPVSPSVAPVSAPKASTVESAGFISGIVIAGVLALAVLVALGILLRRKLSSSRTVQPPGKIIVRLHSKPFFEEFDESFFTLSFAGV